MIAKKNELVADKHWKFREDTELIPMLELRLLFGFANVTIGKNNFSCNKQTNKKVWNDDVIVQKPHINTMVNDINTR